MYPIFNGIQAYVCKLLLLLLLLLIIICSVSYKLCYFVTVEPNTASLTVIDKNGCLVLQIMFEEKVIYMNVMQIIGRFVSFCAVLGTGLSDLC
jgi:hypothetical protein